MEQTSGRKGWEVEGEMWRDPAVVQQEAGEGTEGSVSAAKLRSRLKGVAYVITAAASLQKK